MVEFNKYHVIKKAINYELANFVFNYFLLKRYAANFMYQNNIIADTGMWGTWSDQQIPNTYSHYADPVMETLLVKVLPIKDITHITRKEFVNGTEQKFYDALLQSMTEHGMRDPVFIDQRKDKNDNLILKVTVGNNRMVIAKN